MTSVSTLPVALGPEQGLSRYLAEIRRFPLLGKEEELMLAERWRSHGDLEAAAMLVKSHLRLVVKIAMGYRGYGLPIGEIISEGNLGLMQAARKFDPERGFRLSTYAVWWIKAQIQEYVLRSWSLVKMGTTAAQKKLFFNLRRLRGELQAFEQGSMAPQNIEKIAKKLDVSEAEVDQMDMRLSHIDVSLNTPINSEGGDEQWQDVLTYEDAPGHAEEYAGRDQFIARMELLDEGLQFLNERERDIFTNRRLRDPVLTLDELSKQYGVSRERIRQIEVRAFAKVQKAMRRLADERQMD